MPLRNTGNLYDFSGLGKKEKKMSILKIHIHTIYTIYKMSILKIHIHTIYTIYILKINTYIDTILTIQNEHLNTYSMGQIFNVFQRSHLCSSSLNLFDQKYRTKKILLRFKIMFFHILSNIIPSYDAKLNFQHL